MKYFGTKEAVKYKYLDLERLIISFDRLTRFKNTEEKYLRVFKDIIVNNLINPKYKKVELDEMDYGDLTEIATDIINASTENLTQKYIATDYLVNKRLKAYEENTFILKPTVKKLLDNEINYDALISILPENIPKNLKWLKLLGNSNFADKESLSYGYHFPIKKLVICEGITEEILLPVFADLLGYNFDKNGVHIISAGGKNQVVKLFYKLSDTLKLPIFILLDSDAVQNYNEIILKLRNFDKIYMLTHGEFEDNLPVKLIEKALRYSIANISLSPTEDYNSSEGMVEYLENFYKTRGAHEFKKAEFAQIVKKNITGIDDVSDEFKNIINEIKSIH